MKKLFFAAAIAVFGFTTVNAQDDVTEFGFEEGNVFVEGSLGFSSTNNKNLDTKSNTFNFTPKVGYFLNDDLAVGVQLDFGTAKSSTSGTDTSKNSNIGIGAFGRYYFLDLGKRFKTYTELGVGYNTLDDKISDVKVNSIGAGLDLGLNYFVTENIALTFGLDNVLAYSSSKVDVSGAKATNSFEFGIGEVNNPFGGTAKFGVLFVF